MAFTASTVWEVESGGDDTNFGGGFDTGVAGFPTDGAATSATGNSPVFSSASYNFVAGDVGAWIYIKSGTNWTPGWYKIASVASNNATLSAAIGVAFNTTLNGPNIVAGCATTASPTSATWGIDYSQSTTSRISFTDILVGATTTQFTSVLNPVGKNFIGNIISVISGATVQRVVIISTSTITATCDKSLGTAAQTGVGQMGGCFGSLGAVGAIALALNFIWIKTATYSISSSSSNVSGGIFAVALTGLYTEGYGTVRGDLGTPPTLQVAIGVSSVTIYSNANASYNRNIIVDGNSKTSINGFSCNVGTVDLCTAINCTNGGFGGNSGGGMLRCKATGCTGSTAAFSLGNGFALFDCEAYSNSVTGFNITARGICVNCLSYANSGVSSDGFTIAGNGSVLLTNCVAYGNGKDGVRVTYAGGSAGGAYCINVISEANTGFGFGANSGSRFLIRLSCAAYSNTGGNIDPLLLGQVSQAIIVGSGSFFVNAAGGNFALNNTAGAGASARATGIPGTYPAGNTIGYLDIGAAQHADPASMIFSRLWVGM